MQILDMMLSMHARLRDILQRRAFALDVSIFSLSILLCATVFLDPQLAALASIGATGVRMLLGAMSVFVLLLSVVDLRVDWKEAAGRHGRAFTVLADLNVRGRLIEADSGVVTAGADEFARVYDLTMASLPSIPEARFAPLKAYHYRKVALSRAISRYPNVPIFVLQLKLFFVDIKGVLNHTDPSRSDEHSG